MHVTILQVTGEKRTSYHPDEDDVFCDNRSYFPEGVSEHSGSERDDDIRGFVEWLGSAALHGTEVVDGESMTWVDIDPDMIPLLMNDSWGRFRRALESLMGMGEADFCRSTGEMPLAVQRLHDAYFFDHMYVMDDSGSVKPISEWLRYEFDGTSYPLKRRKLYVHATYDGGQ